MDAASFLHERSVEDILAREVHLVLGGQEFTLPVLNIAENRAWKAKFNEALPRLLSGPEPDNTALILAYIGAHPDDLLALLQAYDRDHVLPAGDWIMEHESEQGLLAAFLEVLSAADPLDRAAIMQVLTGPPPRPTPSEDTSLSPPSTAGRHRPSSAK